jgi:hypothetical protein
VISVAIESTGTIMAKDRTTSPLKEWLGPAVIIAVIFFVANYFSGQLETVRNKIDSHGESIARLEERLNSLDERTKKYKAKAVAAGFTNPQIVTASLQTNAKFESRTPGQKGDYFISYTILAYDPITSEMQLRMDAQLPDGSKYEDNTIGIKIRTGELVELTRVIPVGALKIYLQVLDIPVRDQAILAIGHKQDEAGKLS